MSISVWDEAKLDFFLSQALFLKIAKVMQVYMIIWCSGKTDVIQNKGNQTQNKP